MLSRQLARGDGTPRSDRDPEATVLDPPLSAAGSSRRESAGGGASSLTPASASDPRSLARSALHLRQSWRGILALGVLGAWALVCAARLTHFVETPKLLVGQGIEPFVAFAREVIPPTENVMWVSTIQYRPEEGVEPRLRYELFPRGVVDYRGTAAESEDLQRALAHLRHHGLRYVVVPNGDAYNRSHWVRQELPYFRRIPLDETRYVLELVGAPNGS